MSNRPEPTFWLFTYLREGQVQNTCLKQMNAALRICAILVLLTHLAFAQKVGAKNYRQDQIIVLLSHSASLDAVCNKIRSTTGVKCSGTLLSHGHLNLALIEFSAEEIEVEVMLDKVKSLSGVDIAQFNHTNLVLRSVPNDSLFNKQWSLLNDGTNGSSAGSGNSDISATAAWQFTTGGITRLGDTIVVGIVDGGFDIEHVDLKANIFKNRMEIPGNGIDDDNNGFIDDCIGWNFYSNSPDLWMDSHGTHVAGTIGAVGNNNIGIAGINWNIKILPVSGSSTLESTVVSAYAYMLNMRRRWNISQGAEGAYIVAINNSFGVDYGQPDDFPIWCAMYDSMGFEGILNIAATINKNENVDSVGDIPTACPSQFLISVTNTQSNDQLYYALGAGFGKNHIDLAAPGTKIMSTNVNNTYGLNSGTSMATPHVTGALALMYSAVCEQGLINGQFDPSTLAIDIRKRLLKRGVDQISGLQGLVATSGRLNLLKAIQSVSDSCLHVTLSIQPSDCGACNGSIAAVVSGNIGSPTIQWSHGLGLGSYKTNLCPGYYSVTVTDLSGDTIIRSVALSDVGGPQVSTSYTPLICPDHKNSTINVAGGYNYQWNDGGSGASRSGMGAGTYVLTATDQSGNCTTVVEVIIKGPRPFVPKYGFRPTASPNDNTGAIYFTLVGGTPPYSYLWNTGATSANLTNINYGLYTITVTDSKGCKFTDAILFDVPAGINETKSHETKVYPNPASGQIVIVANEGILNTEIIDLGGRLVLREKQAETNTVIMDVSGLKSGYYHLKIETSRTISTVALIVTHGW